MTELFDPATGEILAPPEDSAVIAFAIYMQEASKQEHWVKHRRLIKPWRVSIKERMDEHDGIASWREAITIAARSDFLCGRIIGARGRFQLDVNFLVQPRSFAKILDGFYTRDQGPATQKLTLPTMQPPHLKPQPAFVPEHPDIRDAAAIISWRKIGRYDKANEVETRMAARQGRPAVHVPAPELAHMARDGNSAQPNPSGPDVRTQAGKALPQGEEIASGRYRYSANGTAAEGSLSRPAPRQPAQGPVSEPEWETMEPVHD